MKALIYNGNDVIVITPTLLKYVFSEKKIVDLLLGTAVFLDTLQRPEALVDAKLNGEPITKDTIYSVVRGMGHIKDRLAEMVGRRGMEDIVKRIDEVIKESNEN